MNRKALLVACSEYDDHHVRRLRTPVHDIEAIGALLDDPAIGGYELTTSVDETEAVVRRKVGRFLRGASRTDLLLLYFACHGFKESDGQLFLGAKDTCLSDVMSTALPAQLLCALLDVSPARGTVLVLDCCYSGAISRSFSARDADAVQVGEIFAGRRQGEGRVVITASKATEYAFEPGDEPVTLRENPAHSVFAEAFIEGLRTGEADLDGDGVVSAEELYLYVHGKVLDSAAAQTPEIANRVAGKLIVAHRAPANPIGVDAAPAPEVVRRSPFDADLLDWRSAVPDGLWTSFAKVSRPVEQAFRAAGNGDWTGARRLFDRLRGDEGAAVRWGCALCDAVEHNWHEAGSGFAPIAHDGDEAPNVVAGAGLLATVALRAAGSPAWHEPLEDVLERVPTCPQALAYRGVHLDDPGSLSLALLLEPELIEDFAAVAAPVNSAVADALADAQQRVALLVRVRAETDRLVASPGADRPAAPAEPVERVGRLRVAWQTVVRERRRLSERLAWLNARAQHLLDDVADAHSMDSVRVIRRSSAELLDALRRTDLPAPVRALGIPPGIPVRR